MSWASRRHVVFLTSREKTRPGTIGSQKLSPRNNSVPARATGTETPASFNVTTDAASNTPRPPGMMPMVRSRLETMKLANTPAGDATSPSERMSSQTVAASSSTMASWNKPLLKMRTRL